MGSNRGNTVERVAEQTTAANSNLWSNSQRWFAAALLVSQPLLFFRSVFFSRKRHIPFDIEEWHLPIAKYFAQCAREHVWPLWNPYESCGKPAFNDIQAQLFYPITWIAIALGNAGNSHRIWYWYQALVPLHMMIGGFFSYVLLRRLRSTIPAAVLGATVFELGAFTASQAEHFSAICCGAWLPLILLCLVSLGERLTMRWTGILGLAVAMNILGGFPAVTAVCFAVAAMWAVGLMLLRQSRWPMLPGALAGCALGILISSVQLVPTVRAIDLTIAKLRADWHQSGGGLPLESLISFIRPNFHHVFTPFNPKLYTLPYNFTFLYTFCGHAPGILLFAAVPLAIVRFRHRESKVVMLTTVLTGISALWMLGDHTPVYRWLFHHAPRLLRGSLYAEFALLAFTLFVGITAALALTQLRGRYAVPVVWLIAIGTSAELIAVSSNRPMNTAAGSHGPANADYPLNGDSVSLAKFHQIMNCSNPPLRLDFVRQDDPSLFVTPATLGIYSALSDSPFMTLRYYYFRLNITNARYWERLQTLATPNTPWVDALNDGLLNFRAAGAPFPEFPKEKFDAINLKGILLWRNKTPLPRFYLVNTIIRSSGMEESRKLISNSNPATEAVVEGLDSGWAGSALEGSSVRVVKYTPNAVELNIHTRGPAYLVSSEVFYPGWSATLNSKSVPVLPTNLAFRGIPVPAGESDIVMNYHSEYFGLSIILSLTGLLIAGMLVVGGRSTRYAPKRQR